jgi:hypothetical protein
MSRQDRVCRLYPSSKPDRCQPHTPYTRSSPRCQCNIPHYTADTGWQRCLAGTDPLDTACTAPLPAARIRQVSKNYTGMLTTIQSRQQQTLLCCCMNRTHTGYTPILGQVQHIQHYKGRIQNDQISPVFQHHTANNQCLHTQSMNYPQHKVCTQFPGRLQDSRMSQANTVHIDTCCFYRLLC